MNAGLISIDYSWSINQGIYEQQVSSVQSESTIEQKKTIKLSQKGGNSNQMQSQTSSQSGR